MAENPQRESIESIVAQLERTASVRRRVGVPVINRAEATMEAIEQYILASNLRPGDPLPTEAELCADLGVSRSSVREALRKLQALDIVAVRQGRGTYVGELSMSPFVKTMVLRASMAADSIESLCEVVAVRQILELGIAAEVVADLGGQHHEDLHELVNRMIEKADAGKKFLEEDIAFHQRLVAGTGNALMEQLTGAMWMVHMAVVPQLPTGEASLLATAHNHKKMLEAAESGDLEAYKAAIHDHYQPLLDILQQVS
ncbi:MAG: GntR family transcriptional regulator [Flaviflexus sp.]|nr:GntR family transcriptional regulator [Flaviflexus sp.]